MKRYTIGSYVLIINNEDDYTVKGFPYSAGLWKRRRTICLISFSRTNYRRSGF
jgi:hypothetical protein